MVIFAKFFATHMENTLNKLKVRFYDSMCCRMQPISINRKNKILSLMVELWYSNSSCLLKVFAFLPYAVHCTG